MGKLVELCEGIWGVDGGDDYARGDLAIEKTEAFFRSLGLPTRLGEAGIGEETILEIERRFNARKVAFGENQNGTGTVARQILENCK